MVCYALLVTQRDGKHELLSLLRVIMPFHLHTKAVSAAAILALVISRDCTAAPFSRDTGSCKDPTLEVQQAPTRSLRALQVSDMEGYIANR